MKKIAFILVFSFLGNLIIAQSAHSLLRDGNSAYESEEYSAAAEKYYKALEKDPDNITGKFNLGNATYQTDGYDEAIQHYSSAAELAKDNQVKADAYYNLGNALFQKAKEDQGKGLEKSVEAYKNSLRLNPKDLDTKKNLALSQRLLVQQKQQQQKQQQEQNKEKKDQDEKDKQEQSDDQQQNDDQQENDQQQNQKQQDQNENQKQQEAKDLSKEEALELLKIMDEEERKVQEKMRRAKGKGKKPEKDW